MNVERKKTETDVSLVHICLISDNLPPNLIPVLALKPDHVYAVVTNDRMKMIAKRFASCISRFCDGIKYYRIEDFPSSDLPQIRNKAVEILDSLIKKHRQSKPVLHVVVNVTGGNKPMTTGFLQAVEHLSKKKVEGLQISTLYVDTETDHLEYFSPTPERTPMPHVLNVERYLAVQGFVIDKKTLSNTEERKIRALSRKDTTFHLATDLTDNERKFITSLNALASSALDKDKNLKRPEQSLNHLPRGAQSDLLNRLSNDGILQWRVDRPKSVTFIDAEKTGYISGGWLEEYIWLVAKSITGLEDSAMGVSGTWQDSRSDESSVPNEFDFLATSHNRMLFVECKTARLLAPGPEGQNDLCDKCKNPRNQKLQDIIHKIDALGSKARGLFGTTVMLSMLKLDRTARERAQKANITVLEGSEGLAGLKNKIEAWAGSL